MAKTQKLIYLSDEAIQKLEILKTVNNLDNSKVIEILLKKVKKIELF